MNKSEVDKVTDAIWARVEEDLSADFEKRGFKGLVGFGAMLYSPQSGSNRSRSRSKKRSTRSSKWALRISKEPNKDGYGWEDDIQTIVSEVVENREIEDWEIVTSDSGAQVALASNVGPGSRVQRRVGNTVAGPSSTVGAQVTIDPPSSKRLLLGSEHALMNFRAGSPGDDVHICRLSPTGHITTHVGELKLQPRIDYNDKTIEYIDATLVAIDPECTVSSVAPCFGGKKFGLPANPSQGEEVSKCGAINPWITSGRVALVTNGHYLVTFPAPLGGAQTQDWFHDQFLIEGDPTSLYPFAQPGDSGSLIVSNDGNLHPRGLLVSGSENRREFVANKIERVMADLNITAILQ